jgi:hypothetical protein
VLFKQAEKAVFPYEELHGPYAMARRLFHNASIKYSEDLESTTEEAKSSALKYK